MKSTATFSIFKQNPDLNLIKYHIPTNYIQPILVYQKNKLYFCLKLNQTKNHYISPSGMITPISYIDLLSACREEQPFKTSLEVIGKILNVPESALKALLRLNGYDDNIEPSSICIDEEMLAIFTEAYVRKMRSYFLNSNRHLNLLSPQEAADLEQFYQTFKKKGDYRTNNRDWSHIDTDLISKVFVQKVKKETSSQSPVIISGIKLLEHLIEVNSVICHKAPPKIEELPLSYTKEWYIPDEVSCLCDRITHSRFYVLKLTHLLIQHYLALTFFYIKSICVFARYYIFSSDDGDETYCINFLSCDFKIHDIKLMQII